MADPVVEQPTPPAPAAEPKPISLSESGNPVETGTPTVAPTESHEPIPTGDALSGVSAETPQIISAPKLPDVQIAPSEDKLPWKDSSDSTSKETFVPLSTGPKELPNESAPTLEAQPATSEVAPIPEATFSETKIPPPETTIAPEVPSAPARTGWIDKLKGLIGR